jgi:hypothetical protein
MSIFSYHLVQTSLLSTLKSILFSPDPEKVKGLVHMECMSVMTLGSPILSPQRFLARKLVVFAQWEDELALQEFLLNEKLGKQISEGWHVRLMFLRQWGSLSKFNFPEANPELDQPNNPIVAVTIARMRLFQVPRFIKWGRPVEKLVRDHPGTTLSLASIRFPRTVSTFSIWKTQKEMTDMVQGHSAVPQPKRHIDAMQERNRKDFHFEFTTLRFKALSEHGTWEGRSNYIPGV